MSKRDAGLKVVTQDMWETSAYERGQADERQRIASELMSPSVTQKQLSVEYACGSQEYWDIEPDGSLLIDIPHDHVVVSSADLDHAPGLDELLDSVHPWAKLYDVALLQAGDWVADIHWPRDMHNDYGNWHEAQGVGPTRMDAIRNAVAQATTTQEGTSDE